MTLFLRDGFNNTLLDMEVFRKDNYVDISSSVDINNYSGFLLMADEDKREEIIEYFDFLSEIRGWLWESYFMCVRENTIKEYDNVLDEVRKILDEIGERLGLHRVED